MTVAFFVAFAALLGQITYWQFGRSEDLAGHPRNRRVWEALDAIKRGRIFDRQEQALAFSVAPEREEPPASGQRLRRPAPAASRVVSYRRKYPYGPLWAQVVGYTSRIYGQAGLEAAFNRELLALEAVRSPLIQWRNRFLGREEVGYDLLLTVDTNLQRTALTALGARRGAVVAIDPRTGAVLALASWPTFDPNTVDEKWAALQNAPGQVLLNRALQGLYPPGSTFKIFTAAAALDSGAVKPTSLFTCRGEEAVAHTRIRCLRRSGHGRLTVAQGVAKSCNLVLAKVALKTGAAAFEEYGRRFGFKVSPPDFPLPVAASQIPPADRLDGAMLAACGFGQGALALTPFQMALVTAAIANKGILMQPYLVQEIRSPEGQKLAEHRPRVWQQAITARTAAQVAEMMQAVMKPGGTASHLRLPGVTLAGKTGTAQNPQGRTHAWFVAFAPAARPTIAVAVIVENGGVGGQVAGPIALAVIQAALGKRPPDPLKGGSENREQHTPE